MRSIPKSSDPPKANPSSRAPRQSNGPRYAYLAKILIDGVVSGKYPVGSLLPTELEISERFQLSRQTVREALRKLSNLGLVERKPGVGTRVRQAHTQSRYSYTVESIADLLEYAQEVRLIVHSIEKIEARGALADFLACRDATPWLCIKGTRWHGGDDVPIAVSEIFMRMNYPGIERYLRRPQTPITSILEKRYGEVVEEIRQEIFAVAMPAEAAAVLVVPPGAPGLEVRRRFYGSAGRLIFVGRILHASERFSYSMRFQRDFGIEV